MNTPDLPASPQSGWSNGRSKKRLTAMAAGVAMTLSLVAAPALTNIGTQSSWASEAEPIATFTGIDGSAAGSVVSGNGCDFTGDGKDDIVTSAWMRERAPHGRTGAAYVVPSGTESAELDDPTSGIIRIERPLQEDALVGFSAACAGDVNGDGFDDLVIGEYINNRVWIVFGSNRPDDQIINLSYLRDRGFAIERTGTDDRTGFFVSGVGDVDEDGFDDVAVISLKAQNGGGQVSIVKGRDDIATVDLDESTEAIARFNGVKEQAPSFISRVGDVDADGSSDFAIGGYVATPDGAERAAGMTWVVSGSSRGDVDLTGDIDGFIVNGPV